MSHIEIIRAFVHIKIMSYRRMTDQEILRDLAERLDHLRRSKAFTDREVAERGGASVRTLVAFRRANKDIALTSFIKLLRGIGELERLEQLLPAAEPVFSPAKQAYVQPPKRVRHKRPGPKADSFSWGDES